MTGPNQRLDRAIREFMSAMGRSSIAVRPGLSAASIAQLSMSLGRPLPEDLRVVYTFFAGIQLEDVPVTVNAPIRIWPGTELRVAGPHESGDFGDCLVFADYLLSSSEYGIAFSDGKIVNLCGAKSSVAAPDLAEFLHRCAMGEMPD